jgi:cytochrome-b5 reductase
MSDYSIPGNPRNKVALRPGFSLMDWIRLTKSGQDLSGTGGRILEISPKELAKHRTRKDAWMAINGKFLTMTCSF